jgi:hypothetical protein
MSDRPAEEQVQDPNEYSTNTRLEHIFETRRELREIRREASKHRHSGASVSQQMRAVQYYRSGVESYILELDNLFRENDSGRELWEEKEYGYVTIEPPLEIEQRRGQLYAKNEQLDNNVALKLDSVPKAVRYPIVGLKWLFEHPSPVKQKFEYEIGNKRHDGVYTDVNKSTVPWTVLNSMVSDVNAFLGDLGIGLDVGEAEDGGWDTGYRSNGHNDPSA